MKKNTWSAEVNTVVRHEAAVLARNPTGERADQALDGVVKRHNACARALLAESGQDLVPRGAALFRLLQVRFVNLVCRAKGETRRAVVKVVAEHPPIDVVLREALRPFFAEVAAWNPSHGILPKSPDAYWRQAFVGLTADAERWGREQKPAGVAQHRHYLIQGADYSL